MTGDKSIKYYKLICIIFIGILTIGCTNEFLGAKKIIYNRGFYVERWFLSPDYSEKDIPSGTAFYGASANKIRKKFIIKYYIHDEFNSEIVIPESNIWLIINNGKRFNYEDANDDDFFYTKSTTNTYKKYMGKGAKRPLTIHKVDSIPIKSCDDKGWCKVYPNDYSNDLYVKQTILKKPLSSI
jgi:hypothetical protein